MIAVVGPLSALVSPRTCAPPGAASSARGARAHCYYVALYLFWADAAGVPIADNLAVAWLLVEATTAASALLVASAVAATRSRPAGSTSCSPRSGLTVALLGIVVLALTLSGAGHGGLCALDWDALATSAGALTTRPRSSRSC